MLENCNGFFPVRARATEKTNPPERFADGVLAEFKFQFVGEIATGSTADPSRFVRRRGPPKCNGVGTRRRAMKAQKH